MKYFFSLSLYRLIMLLASPLLWLALIIRSFSQKQYRERIGERFGCYSQEMQQGGIVIHGASVGEVLALKAFINKTLAEFPQLAITVTTFTPTGSAQVTKLFGDKVQHCYLPLDNPISNWLFLRKLKPQAMVFMETELWPSLIKQCHNQAIKLLLINGRLSPSSVKSYRKLAWLFTPSLQYFDKILTQSQINQDNFIALGANDVTTNNNTGQQPRCQLSGNLKYDINIDQQTLNKQTQLAKFIESERDIWVLASTHEGDEQLTINAFKQLQVNFPQLLLVIIPRHPERFDSVAELCQTNELSLARRSQNQAVTADTKVWLIDTLGELLATTALANVVTMGGTFSHIGGHNPLEPALFKKPIIVGSDMHNFVEVAQQLRDAGGIIELELANPSEQLVHHVGELLSSKIKQQTLGENAYQVVQQNQGASDKSIAALKALIDSK